MCAHAATPPPQPPPDARDTPWASGAVPCFPPPSPECPPAAGAATAERAPTRGVRTTQHYSMPTPHAVRALISRSRRRALRSCAQAAA